MTTRGTRRPACDVTAQEKLWSPAPCASAARGPSRPSPPSRSSLRGEQTRREKGGPDLRGWNILRSSISPRKRRLRKKSPHPLTLSPPPAPHTPRLRPLSCNSSPPNRRVCSPSRTPGRHRLGGGVPRHPPCVYISSSPSLVFVTRSLNIFSRRL